MKVFLCENNTKGNHYVGAEDIFQAVRVFKSNTGLDPEKITLAGTLLMETNLSLVKGRKIK